jgi:hypothetical protein
MYTPSAYYWAKVSISSLTFFFYPFLLTLCSIWLFGLPVMGFKGFCEWWGILTIMAFVGSSFGFMLGCILATSHIS